MPFVYSITIHAFSEFLCNSIRRKIVCKGVDG